MDDNNYATALKTTILRNTDKGYEEMAGQREHALARLRNCPELRIPGLVYESRIFSGGIVSVLNPQHFLFSYETPQKAMEAVRNLGLEAHLPSVEQKANPLAGTPMEELGSRIPSTGCF